MTSPPDDAPEDGDSDSMKNADGETEKNPRPRRENHNHWQGLIALLMIPLTIWATYCAIEAGETVKDRDVLTSIQLSIAVGSICSLVPGVLLGIFFEVGTSPFLAFGRWVRFESLTFYFSLTLIFLIVGGITIWAMHKFLTVSFTPTELVISLVAGSIMGATLVPILVSHVPKRS